MRTAALSTTTHRVISRFLNRRVAGHCSSSYKQKIAKIAEKYSYTADGDSTSVFSVAENL